MTRHVDVVVGEAVNGQDEQITGSLPKAVYDLLNGKTFIGMAAVKNGQNTAVIVVWDD